MSFIVRVSWYLSRKTIFFSLLSLFNAYPYNIHTQCTINVFIIQLLRQEKL